MTGIFIRPRNLGTDTHRGKTQDEDSHLQARERGLKEILPSWLSEKTNPADLLISDF